jgi:predicted nucleotidyltransferase
MSSIDARSEQYSAEFTEKVVELLQDDVISIILYGSGAANYFRPGESDVNILVVLQEIKYDRLQQVSKATHKFKLGGVEPLYMKLSEFREFPEYFPLEALNIKNSHLILYGEDLAGPLRVSNSDVQAQLVRELISKTLRCRYLYEEHGEDKKRCLKVITQLITPYQVMMRAVLQLLDDEFLPPHEFLELAAQFEERHGLILEGLREAYHVKAGTKKLLGDEHRTLMQRIIHESSLLTEFASEMLTARI